MAKYASGETTKQRLIDAAGKLAADVGIDSISTRGVAELSGENIGSIHYHFGGKDGLLKAVVYDAIRSCLEKPFNMAVDHLGDDTSPGELSRMVRVAIRGEIDDLFRADRPAWHSQVIYQLLQRDDALYDIFSNEVMEPAMDAMSRFFKVLDPAMGDEEVYQHVITMKMPIFAHANYKKAMLKLLGVTEYSNEYLQKLEDLLVRQTQLLLGLPED